MALALLWLGIPVVRLDGVELRLGAKAVAMLAMLSVDGRANRRDVGRLLWADASDALNSVSAARVQLGKVLGDYLGGDTETLVLQGDWSCDVPSVRAAWQSGQDTASAFALYRGDFLEGLRLPEWSRGVGEEFESWLYQNRESLAEIRFDLATRLGSGLATNQQLEQAVQFLQVTQSSLQPREDAARLLLLCLGALGRLDEAISVFARLEKALLEDLGVPPLAKTRDALEMVRTGREAARAELLRELGMAKPNLLQISQAETDVPLVGRALEQQRLQDELTRTRAGETRLVWLAGEPGVGKTRLAREVMQLASQEGWLVALAEATQSDGVLALLERVLRRVMRQTSLAALRLELQEAVQQLLGELPTKSEFSERMLLEALRTLLVQVSEPVVLVLDDVQWIDAASLRVVMQLLRANIKQGLLLIATIRDTEIPRSDLQMLIEFIGREGRGTRLKLTGLSVAETLSLAAMLGRNTTQAELLHQSSGGNPFFLLELFRSTGTVVPERVQDALRARIARLPAIASQMLDALAILGSTNQGVLREVAGRSLEESAEALEYLEFAGLIRFENSDVFFAHDLTREAALRDLSYARCEVLNLRAARALRAPVQAALHYWAAKNLWDETDTEKAAVVFIQAAVQAAQRGVLQTHWFERAQEVSKDYQTRAKALTEQGRALERFGQHQQALEVLDHAEVILQNSANLMARAAPLVVRANLLALKLGRLEEAVPLAEQALEWLATEHSDEARLLQSDAQSTLGTVARLRGQFTEAAEFFAGALRLRQALRDRPRIAAALNNLGTALVKLQDPSAEQTLLSGVQLCEEIGDVINMARCLNNLGVLYNDVLKRHDAARAAYLKVQQLQEEIGDTWGIALSTLNLGVTAFHQQLLEEAKTHYLETLRLTNDFPQLQHEALYNLAEVELALSNYQIAKVHIEHLMRLLSQIPEQSSEYDAAFIADAKALAASIQGGS